VAARILVTGAGHEMMIMVMLVVVMMHGEAVSDRPDVFRACDCSVLLMILIEQSSLV
jgi:hypothetical protein